MIAFENDLQPLCKVLPRLPKDLPILVIQTQDKDKYPLRVRHEKVKNALIYLKDHNPAYKDIVISDENLTVYKEFEDQDKPVEGIQVQIYDGEDFQKTDEEIVHETETIKESDLNGDIPFASSTVAEMTTSKDNMGLIKEAIQLVGEKEKELKFNRPKRKEEPVSEFIEYYYSMAFPNLFPDGTGDYNQMSTSFLSKSAQKITTNNFFILRFFLDPNLLSLIGPDTCWSMKTVDLKMIQCLCK